MDVIKHTQSSTTGYDIYFSKKQLDISNFDPEII